jgi:hypothetical protein
MKQKLAKTVIFTMISSLFGGCSSLIQVPDEIKKTEAHHAFERDRSYASTPNNDVQILAGSHAGLYTDKSDSHRQDWLRTKRVSLEINTPVTATALMKMFRDNGINMTSSIPLDDYMYSGLGVRNADAESSLKMVFGSMGLDYDADATNQYVMIRPMASKTWYVNLGNRTTTFGASGQSSTGTVGSDAGSSVAGSTSGSGSASGSTGASSSTGATNISSKDNFWDSLRAEIKARLNVLVPNKSRLAAFGPGAMSGVGLPPPPPGLDKTASLAAPSAVTGAANTTGMYMRQDVGTYSLNPETGAITVQAPHWILDDIGEYLDKVQDMYNADVTFKGELLIVSNDSDHTEGIDVTAFGLFAKNNYGAVVRNNTLGGVTVNFQDGSRVPSVTAGQQSIAGPLIGLISNVDGLSIFNSFMNQSGTVKVIQKPLITTTSGTPGEFAKVTTSYYNRISQTTATGGTGSASVGITNTLVPVLEGTILKVNPKYDVATGMIRAQMSLEQMIKSGTQNQVQYISSGSSTDQVNTPIPIITKISYNGEALLKDGDMIIIGGQTEDTGQYNDIGLPGTRNNGLLSAFTGNKEIKKGTGTYYFAMQVSIKTNRNVNKTK